MKLTFNIKQALRNAGVALALAGSWRASAPR